MFLAHISGMDTLARGLRNVAKLLEVTENVMTCYNLHMQVCELKICFVSLGWFLGWACPQALPELWQWDWCLDRGMSLYKLGVWFLTLKKDWIGLRLKVLTLVYGFKQAGKGDFETLERKVLEWGEPTVPSGKQVNGMTVQASYPHCRVIVTIQIASHRWLLIV